MVSFIFKATPPKFLESFHSFSGRYLTVYHVYSFLSAFTMLLVFTLTLWLERLTTFSNFCLLYGHCGEMSHFCGARDKTYAFLPVINNQVPTRCMYICITNVNLYVLVLIGKKKKLAKLIFVPNTARTAKTNSYSHPYVYKTI